MDSSYIKNLMIERCSFANGYVGAVVEASNLNAADVVAVKFGGTVQEFEIKVSRADLVGEMRVARVAAGLEDIKSYIRKDAQQELLAQEEVLTKDELQRIYDVSHRLSKTKLEKHRFYLDKTHWQRERPAWDPYNYKRFVPHTFYWCIPYDLLEVCRELNKGLPYGIYVYNMPQSSKYYQKFIVKPARSLGGQGGKLYFELFNRACTMWADTRMDIKRLEKQLEELRNGAK